MDNVYAVIDRRDYVIDIFDNFIDALELANDCDAACIETLEDYDGDEGVVTDTYWIAEMDEPDFVKQKIYALIVGAFSVLTIPILDGDLSFFLFLMPVMIYIFFSEQYWLN